MDIEDVSACSLYISRGIHNFESPSANWSQEVQELWTSSLEQAIQSSGPTGTWNVRQTSCGLIATFSLEADAEAFIQQTNLANIFQGPVQVARFSARDSRYRQSVYLRDVPGAIPLEDLSSALTKQGIVTGTIERCRQHVRVEVLEAAHYEMLISQGLDFFGAARFTAIPERPTTSWRSNNANGALNLLNNNHNQSAFLSGPNGNLNDSINGQNNGVLQCYRCQGFWHVAANCRHLPRCVRCGEPHSVEFCSRPRNNPICCHCSGPHHAAFRQCPVRLQLLNATPLSFTLSSNRVLIGQNASNSSAKAGSSQGQQLQPSTAMR